MVSYIKGFICKKDLKFAVILYLLSIFLYLLCGPNSYLSSIHYNNYCISLPRLMLMSLPVCVVFRAYDEFECNVGIGCVNWVKIMNKYCLYSILPFLIIYILTVNESYGIQILTAFPAALIFANMAAAIFYVIMILLNEVRVALFSSLVFSICGALYAAFEIERFDFLDYFYGCIISYPDLGFLVWCIKGIVIVILLYGIVVGKRE